ncbi:MAG TPA: tol-pal system protein YbgF [Rhizomicrobium sp.]|jgi:tol-pal system protein YbgF|nr:tol-pal system protein YbgF [Rhizomicrobium sp.]
MRKWRVGIVVAAGVLAAVPFAFAQDRAQQIQTESQRLSGDLSDDSGQSKRVAGLFGKSDEEIAAEQAATAAQKQHEDTQDSQIATLNQQVSDLQATVRQLTGQNEQLSHRVGEFEDKIQKMQKDFDYRICVLAQQQLGAGPDDAAAGSDQAAPPPAPAMDCAATHSAPPAPPPDSQVYNAGGPSTLAPPPTNDPHQQYNAAMALLAKAQYPEASAAFQAIVDANPDGDLAPQAVYWLGDIAYVQKDYQGAAREFALEIKKYPASDRAPESMLKLGQTLIAMGKKEEGCTTLGAIKEKFPKDPIDKKAVAARKAASCH